MIVSQELETRTDQKTITNEFWKCSLSDHPECECFPRGNGGIDAQCSVPNNEYRFTAQYTQEDGGRFDIDCPCNKSSPLQDSIYSYLKGIPNSNVRTLQFNFCPLPFSNFPNFFSVHLNLSFVQHLSIRSCAPIPTLSSNYFQNFSQLSILNLQNNNLENLPDGIFEQQTQLKKLWLGENKFKSLRANIFKNLHSLQFLQLGSNQLTDLDYSAFSNLKNLVQLNLQTNSISSLPSNVFQSMTNLEFLDLSNNMIVNLETKTFQFNIKLTELFLKNNYLEELPMDLFFHNRQLKKLSLQSNSKLSFVHPDAFKNLMKLEDLDLSSCNLNQSSLDSNAFQNLSQLTNLNLARNKFTELNPHWFNSLINLKSLDLSDNHLTSVEENTFGNLRLLNILILKRNNLTTLEENVFQGMESLKRLFLTENQLETIHPEAMKPLVHLELIDLAKNNLRFNEGLVSPLDGWRQSPLKYNLKLESINLSENVIESSFFSDWFSMKFLTRLNLSRNVIMELNISELTNFSPVGDIRIDLSYNKIKYILFQWATHVDRPTTNDEQEKLSKILQLDGNPLVCNCNTLYFAQYMNGTMTGVKHSWTIDAPKLVCQEPESLFGVPPILVDPYLFVCKCKATIPSCDCYERPQDKKMLLNCQNRNLTEIPTKVPMVNPGYEIQMNLSYNQIDIGKMNMQASDCCENVTSLDLSNNQLDSSMFGPLGWAQLLHLRFSNLRRLDLTHNNLKNIPSGIVDLWNANDNLTCLLSDNPWDCDCSNLNQLKSLYRRVDDFNQIKCWNGISLSDFSADKSCYLNPVAKYLSLAMPVLALIIFALCVLLFRFRRTLRAWLYTHQLCLWCVVKEDDEDNELVYDAFISFSHLDEEFVIQELVPQLEHPVGGFPDYRLCLHYRDW